MGDQRNERCWNPRRPAVRVLHLVSTFEIKTDTKWLHQLIGRLDRDRFEPAIACLYGGGEMTQRFADLGIPTFNVGTRREISLAAVSRVSRLIRSLSPHVVHTHLIRADLCGGLAARLAGVPVVLSSVYAIGPYRRDKVRRLDGLLDQLARTLATDALAVCQAVRTDLIKRLRWPPDRVAMVHTGTTFSDEPPDASARQRIRDEWRIPDSSPLVLSIARLSYEKGIDVLIRSAAIVHRRQPAARFVVVGDGPLKNALQARIRAAGLDDVVRLAGFRRDIDAVLSAGDLFVLPSLMEGMPNAILEAYNAGLPVVATCAGGLAEAVEHEHSGLVVQPNRARALAAAIMRILDDEPLRRRLARQGRQWARERFSLDRIASQYEGLYERLYRTRTGAERSSAGGRLLRESVANA